MSSDYADLIGLIQFPVTLKVVAGKDVREAVIKAMNKDDKLVRCTVWDNLKHVDIKQGDFIAVGGKASTNQSQPKEDGSTTTYYNLSVTRIAVVPGAVPIEGERTANTRALPNADDVF